MHAPSAYAFYNSINNHHIGVLGCAVGNGEVQMSKGKLLRKRKVRHREKQKLKNPGKRAVRPHKRVAGRSGQIRAKQLQAGTI